MLVAALSTPIIQFCGYLGRAICPIPPYSRNRIGLRVGLTQDRLQFYKTQPCSSMALTGPGAKITRGVEHAVWG